MSSRRCSAWSVYCCCLLLVLFIAGDVSGDVSSDDDVSSAQRDTPLKIEWVRVLKVLGVAIAVTLVVTLIAPLPFYLALWCCGFLKRSQHGANNRRYGDNQVAFCCLPHEYSESQWGKPILYLGCGCLIGIPAGILAGWFSWPHV